MKAQKLDPADLLDEDLINAEFCRRSLRRYIKEAWKVVEPDTPYRHNWHIDAVSDHLEAVSSGQIRKLIINVPPGTMKSLEVCVFWQTWGWITKPHLRTLFASYASHLSNRDSVKCRDILQSNWYQNNWGHRFALKKATEEYISNDKKGFRIATSVGGVGTGERVHIVVNDDLLRANDAHSEAMRRQAILHMEAMSTRAVDPATFSQVIIMQRLHAADPAAWALSQGDWDYLMLPMEFEPTRKCFTSIGFQDPRTVEGELLWPEHFTPDSVADMKKALGTYGYSAQMQQNPRPLGGGIIKGQWLQRYKILPKIKYAKIIGDTAQKTGERNDFSVFECWGFGEDGRIYLLDMIRGKWEAPELKTKCIDFWNKHKTGKPYTLRQLLIEDKASGTGLIQDIKRTGKIPVKGIERTKDKLTRVMDVASYMESGYVWIPEEAHFVSDFVEECEAFTANDSHLHDDQIDPLCDAINDMLVKKGGSFYDL